MARIVGRRRRPTRLEIHQKYVAGQRIDRFAGRPIDDYLAFDAHADFAEAYATEHVSLIRRARKHAVREVFVADLSDMEASNSALLRAID